LRKVQLCSYGGLDGGLDGVLAGVHDRDVVIPESLPRGSKLQAIDGRRDILNGCRLPP